MLNKDFIIRSFCEILELNLQKNLTIDLKHLAFA